jgi:uncharacterized RDD family membrane protein YckC
MTTKYANFWVRLLAAYSEDHLFLLIFSYWLFSISSSTTLAGLWQGFVTGLVILLPLVISSLFIKSYLTSRFGGGIGKLITGLKVEDSDHKYLSFKRSFFRYSAGYMFSSVLFFLGFLSIFKDPQKRAFHDKVVGSYVVVRQTLWPLALILWLMLLFGNFYFLSQAISKATSGPLKFEIFQLVGDYQQQKKNVEEATMSGTRQPVASQSARQASSSASVAKPSSSSGTSNVIFVSLKDSVTSEQVQPLISTLQADSSVLRVQYLTKDQATEAYKSVAPNNSLPFINLGPVLIVILKDANHNSKILNEAKSQPFVQAAYPYSF